MKIDATGTHIKGAVITSVQPSQSQPNSWAFLDVDNHWVHIDAGTIQNLYRTLSNTAAYPAPVSMNKAVPIKGDSLFAEHFKG
jgi:hypothetical protein